MVVTAFPGTSGARDLAGRSLRRRPAGARGTGRESPPRTPGAGDGRSAPATSPRAMPSPPSAPTSGPSPRTIAAASATRTWSTRRSPATAPDCATPCCAPEAGRSVHRQRLLVTYRTAANVTVCSLTTQLGPDRARLRCGAPHFTPAPAEPRLSGRETSARDEKPLDRFSDAFDASTALARRRTRHAHRSTAATTSLPNPHPKQRTVQTRQGGAAKRSQDDDATKDHER
jgi:hypothetical protein